MPEDTEAREMFDILRGAPEPSWQPDGAAFAATGRRQTRHRAFSVVGGAAAFTAAVATTAAVLAAPGAGSHARSVESGGRTSTAAPRPTATPKTAQSTPELGWDMDRAYGGIVYDGPHDGRPAVTMPIEKSLASIYGTVLGAGIRMQPMNPTALWHADDRPGAPSTNNLNQVNADVTWTAGSSGRFRVDFRLKMSDPENDAVFDSKSTGSPCGSDDALSQAWSLLGKVYTSSAPPGMPWNRCVSGSLADGSTIGSTSAVVGSERVLFAYRLFPGKDAVLAIVTEPVAAAQASAQDPWSTDVLVAALSAPSMPAALR